MGYVLFFLYLAAGYWATGKTIYAGKVVFYSGIGTLFVQRMIWGAVLGWLLIPWALIAVGQAKFILVYILVIGIVVAVYWVSAASESNVKRETESQLAKRYQTTQQDNKDTSESSDTGMKTIPTVTADTDTDTSFPDKNLYEAPLSYEIVNARDFSDGYAWVPVYEYTGDYWIDGTQNLLCINTDFEIQFVTSNLYLPSGTSGDFYDGYALVTTFDESSQTYEYVIINTSGEIIWSLEDGDELIFNQYPNCEITDSDLIAEYMGYAVVEYWIDCYEYTGNLVGLLNRDGTWIVEPERPKDSEEREAGEYPYESSRTRDMFSDHGEFQMNAHSYSFSDNDSQDGFYYMSQNVEPHIDVTPGIYDDSDNLVVDLSDYHISSWDYSDGYWLFHIRNDQGVAYITIFSNSGEQTLPPMKAPNSLGTLQEGLVWVEDSSGGYYMDVYGQNKFDKTFVAGNDFHCGAAVVTDFNDNEFYIDTQGNVVFDDKVIAAYVSADIAEESAKGPELTKAPGYVEDSAAVPDYTGQWCDVTSQRCYMIIEQLREGWFSIEIHWSSGATAYTTWTMTAEVGAGGNELTYEDGAREEFNADQEPNRTYVYTSGTGRFSYDGTYLYWQDDVDDAGGPCQFEKAENG